MALEFCASLAFHIIAANPLSHASLLPSGSKVVNTLCEEAFKQQETRLVVEGCWPWKSVECKICPVRWLDMVIYILSFTSIGSKVGNDIASLLLRCGCPATGG